MIKILEKIKKKFAFSKKKPIPLINLHGVIMSDDNKLNVKSKKKEIDKAFKVAKDVVFLSINSPGGAPGQSELLYKYIKNKAVSQNILLLSFIEDYGASGGYWIATIGDKIFCLSTSIVGSIGVISGGFGLQKLLEEYKIERRLFTAGESKNRNDMFQELSDEDRAYTQKILDEMHQVFIEHVKKARPQIHDEVFDARVAIGQSATTNGMVDDVIDMYSYRDKHYEGREIICFEKGKLFDLGPLKNLGFQIKSSPLFLMK